MAANPPGAPPPPPPPPTGESIPTTSLTAASQSNPGLSGINSTTRSPMEPKPSSMSPTGEPAKPRYKDIISTNYRQGGENHYTSEQNRCGTNKGAMWPHSSGGDHGVKDELNELIKCMVCGDTSTGFHYGIHSCEGCKGFFRRSLTQHESYTCSNNGQCDISLYTRNQCQLCRWKKCLAVGMSKEGSRLGRRSKRMIEKMHETIAKQRSVGDGAVKTAGFYGNHPELFTAGKFGPQMPSTSIPGMMHAQGPPMLPHSMASAMYGAMNMNMMNMNANMNMGGGFPGLAGMMGDGTVPPSAIMSHAQSISTIIKQELEQQSDREHSLSETSSVSGGMDMSPPASVSRQSSVPGINEACSSSVNGSRFGEGSDQSPTISSVSLPMKSSEDDRTGLKRPSDCVQDKNEDDKIDGEDAKSARAYSDDGEIDMGAINKMLASGQPVILIPKEMREGSNSGKDVIVPQNPQVMVVPQKGKQQGEDRSRSKSASPGNFSQSELMGAPFSAFHPQHHRMSDRDEKSAAAAYAQLHAKGGAGSQFFQFPGGFGSQQLPHHLPHSSLLPMSQAAAWSSLSQGRPHLPPSPLMPSVSLAQPIPSSTSQQVALGASAFLSQQHLKSEVPSPKSADMHESPRHYKHGSPGKMHPPTDLSNKNKSRMDALDFSALSPPIPSPLASYGLANSPHKAREDDDGEKISVKEEPRSNSVDQDQREAMETLHMIAPPGFNPDEPITPELKRKLVKIIDSVNKSYHDTCFYTFRRIRFLRQRYFPFLGEDPSLKKRCNPKYEHDCSKCTPPNGFPTSMEPQKELNFENKTKLDGSKMWQFFSSKFTSQITRIVNFSKMIPGFKHLDREDQITLIKTGLFEVATIRFSTVADTETNMVYWWTTGDMFSLEDAHQMPLGNLFDLLFDFSRRVNRMYLDDCEYALLSALVIMSPDRPGLKNRERIRQLQLDLLRALNLELSDNHPEDHGLFARLLTTIPKLREIGPEHTRRLMELKIRSPDVNFPPLHAEVFDLNAS